MSVATIGTDIAVSAATPATLNQAGFEAVTWTLEDSCSITSTGSMGGTHDTKEDDTLCPDPKTPTKTKRKNNPFTVALKYDKASTSQPIFETNFKDTTNALVAVRIRLNGRPDNVKYSMMKVVTFDPAGGGAGDDFTLSIDFEREGDWVEVLA